jgi:hypothetical protein
MWGDLPNTIKYDPDATNYYFPDWAVFVSGNGLEEPVGCYLSGMLDSSGPSATVCNCRLELHSVLATCFRDKDTILSIKKNELL